MPIGPSGRQHTSLGLSRHDVLGATRSAPCPWSMRPRYPVLIAAILMALERIRPGAASAEIAIRIPISREDPSRGPGSIATGEQKSQGAA